MSVLALLAPDAVPLALFLPRDQAQLNGGLEFCNCSVSDENQSKLVSAVDPSPAREAALDELQKANLVSRNGRDLVVHRVSTASHVLAGLTPPPSSLYIATGHVTCNATGRAIGSRTGS